MADLQQFDSEWHKTILALQRLMTETGFDPGVAYGLERLRDIINSGTTAIRSADSGFNILRAAKIDPAAKYAVVAEEPKMRTSALKFLQHIYLIEHSGAHCMWIHSLPKEFSNWPSHHIHQKTSTASDVHAILKTENEQFSADQKRQLAGATGHALAWAQRAGMVLSYAASSENTPAKSDALMLVRRWFCTETTTDVELERTIASLNTGFKAIIACLTQGKFILTDWVPIHGAKVPPESNWLSSEAFTFPNRGEGLEVVYIEQAFFGMQGDVIKGPRNWVRILIHELSHLVCNTTDVKSGMDTRYAWFGIGPNPRFPISDTVRNADNWAFFAADCAANLTQGEKNMALRQR